MFVGIWSSIGFGYSFRYQWYSLESNFFFFFAWYGFVYQIIFVFFHSDHSHSIHRQNELFSFGLRADKLFYRKRLRRIQ